MIGGFLKKQGLGYIDESGEYIFHWWVGVLIIGGIGLVSLVAISMIS